MWLLGLFLGLAALTCVSAVPGISLSWETAEGTMESLRTAQTAYDKMLDLCPAILAGILF